MILHGMNAERCLLAGEALGLGYVALSRVSEYARTRVVFIYRSISQCGSRREFKPSSSQG